MFIDFFIGKCEDIRYSTIAKQCSFVVGNRGQKGTQSDSQLDEVLGQQLRQKVRYKKTKKIFAMSRDSISSQVADNLPKCGHNGESCGGEQGGADAEAQHPTLWSQAAS